jgi:hypothetical protein
MFKTTLRNTFILSGVALLGVSTWLAGKQASAPFNLVPTDSANTSAIEYGRSTVPKPEPVPLSTEAPTARPDHTEEMTRLQKIEAQLAQLRGELQAQRDAVRQQQQAVNRLTRALDAEGNSPNADAQELGSEPVESEQEWEQQFFAGFEAEFAGQTVDPEWRKEALAQITAVIDRVIDTQASGVTTNSALLDMDCRTNLCRIELAHGDQMAMDRFAEKFSQLLGWQTSSYYNVSRDPDGSLTTVIYLARNGHTLPEQYN